MLINAAGLFLGACVALIQAAEPPRIALAHPDSADLIPATLSELRFTFDQDMRVGGHSICGGGPGFPEITAPPRWEDARTIVLPVRLEPGRRYELSINCPAAQNFRSAAGTPAEVYPITFVTVNDETEIAALTPDQAAALTDALHDAIDHRYSHRDIRNVDWDARFAEFTPRLRDARTPAAFARAAADLLSVANDLHLGLRVNEVHLGTGRRSVSPNVDRRNFSRTVPEWKPFTHGASGRFEDGIIYLAIDSWAPADERDLPEVLAAIARAENAPGIILDVRLNSGGNELLARQIAARFIDERTIYSRNLIRDPDSPSGWSGPFDRVVTPATNGPKYSGRVAVLMGPACMSSCESFLLMMKKSGTREWFGAPSWGSSGNPRPHDLGHGITILLPSWKDMTVQSDLIEGVGLAPDHAVKWRPGQPDAVLEAALRWLRSPQ